MFLESTRKNINLNTNTEQSDGRLTKVPFCGNKIWLFDKSHKKFVTNHLYIVQFDH